MTRPAKVGRMDPIRKAAEIEERRAKRRAELEAKRAEQYAADLEAVDAYEVEKGVTLDITLRVANFVPGHPTLVGVRTPTELEYKRFFQSVNRAGNADAKMTAHQQLAACCWVYPEADASRKAMLEANPGLLAVVGNKAIKLAELQAEEEGKG